ncbi:hypothetical protein [Amycolatopsis taiwanensis]|uniref:Uncharacterized protein n=1 Tax=Amycolatopsis taiwanensis TaxID=342230 RepID=A0A9W6R7R5_9PSEU|nr:hypothetical protein [Amycolatopsis taiwanensis]GLY70931.1 hypothetical protein Atai01_75500 [Amycolatopsis taiwanensis]
MTDAALSTDARDQAASGLGEVAAEFGAIFGGAPTLAEFLEILGWAIPENSADTDGTFRAPLKFKVTLKGNKRYRSPAESRVHDLDDDLFVKSNAHLGDLVERMRSESGSPVTPQQFSSAILEVLRTGRVTLSDVEVGDIRTLLADVPKKRVAKPKPGDILAIPARGGGYHLAVTLAQNRFGTALGLFDGKSAQGRLDATIRRASRRFPVYTEDSSVKDGTWKVVGHDEDLLALFPADPEIYHKPGAWPGIVDTGEFGAAETSDGTMRLIDAGEARDVGLQDGTYRQAYPSAYLQDVLDERDDNS